MRVIAGTARRLLLSTVPGMDVRPTTDKIKETLFNILMPEIPGCRFLDLFAGSGAIGIEALSRGAGEAVFVDNNKDALSCIKNNIKHTGLTDRARVLGMDYTAALNTLRQEGRAFDIIFIDPPYNKGLESRALSSLAGSGLLTGDSLIVVEASLETELLGIEELGLEIARIKEYKSNKHIFIHPKK